MKTDVLANRKSELEFFREMLAGSSRARILLIDAASSKGKSSLIRHFRRECSDDFCVVHLDFKGAEIGLAGVLHKFRELVGVNSFPQFDAAYQSLRNITIANNTAGGTMDIAAILNVDEKTREYNLAQINAGFFADLRVVSTHLAVIFDTFEKAPPDLKNWIGGAFLPHVSRFSNVHVVIAGQSVPEPSSAAWEDMCARHTLGNIDDVNEWYAYARDAQLPHPLEAITQVVLQCKGDPGQIVGALTGTIAGWSK